MAAESHYLAVYAGICSFVDEQIGRVLDAIARRSDAANTIIVFTSDHGDFCFDYNLCKRNLVLLDALLHVPLLIFWTGRLNPCNAAGTMPEHIDVIPTLLEHHRGDLPWLRGRGAGRVLRYMLFGFGT